MAVFTSHRGDHRSVRVSRNVSSGPKAWSPTGDPWLESLRFMSTCPSCKDVREQGYGFRSLVRSLVDNQPIEAYCAVCSEYWPINVNERAELAWLLLTT